MFNEFIIKSSLSELDKLGFEVVDCSRLFVDAELFGCIFKVKYDNAYLYSRCYTRADLEFSFDKQVLFPINNAIKYYTNDSLSYNEFYEFISTQAFNRADFNHHTPVSFHGGKSEGFFRKLATTYANSKDLFKDFEEIDIEQLIWVV